MKKSQLHANLRNKYLNLVADHLTKNGEEVLLTNSNEISLPCVDEEGNDEFIVITFKVPTGSRDGDVYDGYSIAIDYAEKIKEKEEKAKENAKKKAEKIERDKKMREEKKRLKE